VSIVRSELREGAIVRGAPSIGRRSSLASSSGAFDEQPKTNVVVQFPDAGEREVIHRRAHRAVDASRDRAVARRRAAPSRNSAKNEKKARP
jgi:hypothetical protein